MQNQIHFESSQTPESVIFLPHKCLQGVSAVSPTPNQGSLPPTSCLESEHGSPCVLCDRALILLRTCVSLQSHTAPQQHQLLNAHNLTEPLSF